MAIERNLTLGIDIGGSHITAGLVDMDQRTVLMESIIRNKVNSHGTADEILTAWADTIKEVRIKGFTDIGLAMPGPFDYEKGICLIMGFDKYESLYGMNIREELAARTNIGPAHICFRNDAEAFLEGEIFCGAARGYKHVIGITLGTGLGSAISHNGVTKDAGLSVLDYNGEKIEEWVSTRGITRMYKDLTGKTVNDAETIAALANSDREALSTFELFAHHLSWFLKKIILQESPEVLVIGGNIAHSFELFMGNVEKNLAESGLSLPHIVKATLGENAALIGAACKLITVQNNNTSMTTT